MGVSVETTVGVSVGIGVHVAVGVLVGNGVAVSVAVGNGVLVGNGVAVSVAVGSGVFVAVGVLVGSGVGVSVAVGLGVFVGGGSVGTSVLVGSGVSVAVGTVVAVMVGRRVLVDVGTLVCVTVAAVSGVPVSVGAFVAVGLGSGVGVSVGTGVSVGVSVFVGVGEGRHGCIVTVAFTVGCNTKVGVGVFVGVGDGSNGGDTVLTVSASGVLVAVTTVTKKPKGVSVGTKRRVASLVGVITRSETDVFVGATVLCAVDGRLVGVGVALIGVSGTVMPGADSRVGVVEGTGVNVAPSVDVFPPDSDSFAIGVSVSVGSTGAVTEPLPTKGFVALSAGSAVTTAASGIPSS